VTDSKAIPIRVSIPQNGSVAELVIGPVDDPASITLDLAIAALRASEVEITDDARDRAQALVDGLKPCAVSRGIVAMATPPVHGTDGAITWAVEDPPPAPAPEAVSSDTTSRADHYNRSKFTMVSSGQRIGLVTQPTAGIEGRDVRGRKLACKAGKPVRLRLDETILQDDDGNLIAQRDGILSRSAIGASIRDLLEVEGYVDFSTGNVAFAGDVAVYKGVRDLFVVEAKGNIEVSGLIEAADIRCGGDLIASGGMAGRDRGSIRTGGNLTARYLDSVRIEVGRILRVEREVLHCDTIVHERIDAPSGSIIGGRTRCAGQIRVGTLGTASGTPTDIIVGTVPILDARRADLVAALASLAEAQHALEKQMAQLTAGGGKLSPSMTEKQTALAFELLQLSERVAKCQASLNQVEQRIAAVRTIDVRADRLLYAGVRIILSERAFVIRTDLKGPVLIARGHDGEPILRAGETGSAAPLTSFAHLRSLDSDQPTTRAA
jgi:uncharacterized protein (DUF342 family)